MLAFTHLRGESEEQVQPPSHVEGKPQRRKNGTEQSSKNLSTDIYMQLQYFRFQLIQLSRSLWGISQK